MRRTAIGVHVDRAGLTKAFGLYSESKLSSQKGGRPPKYDWEGSLIDIIAQANTPDGLPEGPGAQAKIENMMSEWFIARTGEGPAISEVRRRAKRVMEAISKVGN
tara:strand:- start:7287 stop:7601 length:315 start_codon:yes stop_codon:yes gene_type:complete